MIIGILDDNPVTNELLTTVLTMHGHQASTFERGFDLLEACKGKDELPYDALLVDLMLPDLSGVQTVQALHQIMPSSLHIPLLFITGAGHQEIANARRELPDIQIIEKPFHYAELIKDIEKIIAQTPRRT